jgi:hypothetical protein
MPLVLPPLPEAAERLCRRLDAPPRLKVHLQLVHACALKILEWLEEHFPGTDIDAIAVLFGAATHDLGKTLYPDELWQGGSRHQDDGPALLESLGVEPSLARFARTHSQWDESMPLEDLVIALSDKAWKGRRIERLEIEIATRLAKDNSIELWDAVHQLDMFLEEIGSGADERLALQRSSWNWGGSKS